MKKQELQDVPVKSQTWKSKNQRNKEITEALKKKEKGLDNVNNT